MEKISAVKPEQIIDIQVNGSFLTRVQMLLLHLVAGKDPQEVMSIMNDVAKNEITSELHAHLQTVAALLSEIETKAREQGVMEEIDYDPSSLEGEA